MNREQPGLIPAIQWLRHYSKAWLQPDIMAGLTTAAVVIPNAMAYAAIAGLPLQVGLYTVLVPIVVYALLGTSRPLSVSTSSTIAILTAAELGAAVPGGAAAELAAAGATLALLVGAMLVLASVLRFGFLANFISYPVLIEAEENLRADGITLWLAALNPAVLEVVRNSRLGDILGEQRMFFNLQTAVARYQQTKTSSEAT